MKFRYEGPDYPINTCFALLEMSIHDSGQLFQVVAVWWIILGEKRHGSLVTEFCLAEYRLAMWGLFGIYFFRIRY